MRLGVVREGALAAVAAVPVAFRVGFGCLGRGRGACDGVCGLRGCDFGLVFVAEAREEGGFFGLGFFGCGCCFAGHCCC